jgi:hypothetical protein
MQTPADPRRWRVLLLALDALALLVTIFLIYTYLDEQAQIENRALASAQLQARAAADQIDRVFTQVMRLANQLADDLSSGAQPYAEIRERLRAEVTAHPDIDGFAVTFEPFVYDPELRLYQHYIYRANGAFETLDGATYDYSIPPGSAPDAPQTAWYHAPLERGAMWNEPFLATGAGRVLIEYGVPFYRVGASERTRETAAGVVTLDYSVQDMRALIGALELGATGYGYVFTPSGTLLAHPIGDYVINQSIFALADRAGDSALRSAAENALAGTPTRLRTTDPVTGEETWTFLEPLPSTGWGLGVVLNRAEFQLDARSNAIRQMEIAIAAAVTIFLATLIIAFPKGYSTRELWIISGVFSILCIVLIGFSWAVTLTALAPDNVRITNHAALNRYVETYTRASGSATPPTQIPTGVLLQAVEFSSPTSVRVNGYIWQRYPAGEGAPDIDQGFMLPGQIGEEAIFDEVQRKQIGDEEWTLWYFGVTIKQRFDPSLFPFDRRTIDLRITPLDFDAPIILTPDLASYDLINPRLLPGLDYEFAINNWLIQASAFGYRQPSYNTTFGIPSRAAAASAPELHFTVETQRSFIGPFMAYLLPGIVVSLMLFAYLLNERAAESKETIKESLSFGAALFFVIAVAHASLRDSVGAIGLTYMEYLYILLYLAIVLVTVNSFFVVHYPDWSLIRFRDNLPIKLIYFPLLTGSLMLITLITFLN